MPIARRLKHNSTNRSRSSRDPFQGYQLVRMMLRPRPLGAVLVLLYCCLIANFTNATISGGCDSSRLIRCQQDVLRDMQVVGLNAASVQYPISGPPYSPSSSAAKQQTYAPASTCRLVRANLDCLLSTTPNCYEVGIQAAQNSDIILRSKRFLEQNQCNEPDSSWQTTFCYRSPEVRACEERYDFTTAGRSLLATNLTICSTYQGFKTCIESHLRLNCKVHEMDMVNEYLIDRAGDLAWRCPTNQTAFSGQLLNYHHQQTNPYSLNNPTGSLLSPVAYGHSAGYGSGSIKDSSSHYEQRPIPTYVGSSQGVGSIRDQPWERFRNPVEHDTRYGISRQPGFIGASGTGEVFDRLVAANAGFDLESTDCPQRAQPFVRDCEDTLQEQQRLARDSRDGNELQRRTCCSLFQYRDCISRVVLDRCADSSPTAVEILMGIRRREMTITCRGFARDLCSGALARALANPIVVLLASIIATFVTYKQTLAN